MQLPSLYYLERYRNKGTRTYSKHSEFTEAAASYQPESQNDQFNMKVYELPTSAVNVYMANPDEDLLQRFLNGNTVNFHVHPQVLEQYPEDPYLKSIRASALNETSQAVIPSSSTRTLFVVDDVPHAVKVHFPFKVSRYTRKMRDEVVEQAVVVSEEMEQNIRKLPADFAFLREVIGITVKETDAANQRPENWGFVVRDMAPFPKVREQRSLVPGFALYGEDCNTEGEAPLLVSLIADSEPVGYVLENIMLPIIRHWLECFKAFGYMLEPHGQNVLLELDTNNTITRIVHRDLSVGIDLRRRAELNLSNEKLNDYNRMEDSAFQSITFDKFIGGHFFDRLVQCCLENYNGITESDFTEPCRAEFAKVFPEYRSYFPETVWYYSEQRDQYNKPLNEDTGETPKWRP
ncbi:IucA/IucC family protein [Reinekea marinisedimentorum]|uniref:IucA/IucC family protein n=1 Tax=Reinekea marinisedimentorum TaxID=230495 RepID=A0A4R3I4F6_9GAMM|nr:IucA/IucC family protein [Reinekea marinisedimentorum]TCS38849.1 IucA/IucC family protein [Reinekea marinisedimentorum]